MFRTLNAEKLNYIANDLEVRPFLGGTNKLDLTEIIENPYNFCFMTDDELGAHILINKQNGVYEVHTISLPEARGKNMLKLMQDARAFMFLQTDCIELQTFVPDEQSQTLLWAKLAGFKQDFRRNNCFDLNGKKIGGTYHSMTYAEWVLKDKANTKIGQLFHSQIEQFELLTHDDDPVHDAWVGATCRSKTLPKAISYYNQWAARTAYGTVEIVSYCPFVINMGNAVLQLNADQSLSVLKVNKECLPGQQLLLLL